MAGERSPAALPARASEGISDEIRGFLFPLPRMALLTGWHRDDLAVVLDPLDDGLGGRVLAVRIDDRQIFVGYFLRSHFFFFLIAD